MKHALLIAFLGIVATSDFAIAQQSGVAGVPVYSQPQFIGWRQVPVTTYQPIYSQPQLIGRQVPVAIPRRCGLMRALRGPYKRRWIFVPQTQQPPNGIASPNLGVGVTNSR